MHDIQKLKNIFTNFQIHEKNPRSFGLAKVVVQGSANNSVVH
ncbi:hypothetical protein ABIB40_004095 [Pedobacter sp. UYP30]